MRQITLYDRLLDPYSIYDDERVWQCRFGYRLKLSILYLEILHKYLFVSSNVETCLSCKERLFVSEGTEQCGYHKKSLPFCLRNLIRAIDARFVICEQKDFVKNLDGT